MGFKDLFIEKEDEEEEFNLDALAAGLSTGDDTLPDTSVETADITIDNDNKDNIVEEIYIANNLSNLDKSIFKVEDLMKTLPSEMPTASKKSTVESIMNTVGLNVDDTVEDGNERIKILNASLNKTVDSISSDIATAEEKIEQLKIEISENEKLISDSKETIKEFTEDVNAETERINGLIKFIKGE